MLHSCSLTRSTSPSAMSNQIIRLRLKQKAAINHTKQLGQQCYVLDATTDADCRNGLQAVLGKKGGRVSHPDQKNLVATSSKGVMSQSSLLEDISMPPQEGNNCYCN